MSHCCPAYGKNLSFVKISGADLSESQPGKGKTQRSKSKDVQKRPLEHGVN